MSTMLVVVSLLLSTASIAERSESGWTTITLTGLCSFTVAMTGFSTESRKSRSQGCRTKLRQRYSVNV